MATTIDRIGRSGEFAVASQLALISDTVSLVPHNSYADIIFEYQRNLYKVQVKTSSKERNDGWNGRLYCDEAMGS